MPRFSLRALRSRNYRLFFAGQLTSTIGLQMQMVAQTWLLLELTGDPLVLGLAATMQAIPAIAFGLLSGVMVDHLPKRRTLIATRAVAMVIAFAVFLLVVSGSVQVWQLLVLALLTGITNVVDSAARQAFYVEMVDRSDLPSLVGFNWTMANIAQIIGPIIAGFTIDRFSVAVPYLLNALSFLAIIGAYLAMRTSDLRIAEVQRMPAVSHIADRLVEGLQYAVRSRLVLAAVVVVGFTQAFGMSYAVVVPSISAEIVGADAGAYGLLLAVAGVGSTIASVAVAFSRTVRPIAMAVGAMALGGAMLAISTATTYPLLVVAMLVVGLGGMTASATSNATVQVEVSDQVRARVMSVYTTTLAGSALVGGLVIGVVASAIGPQAGAAVGGAVCIVVAISTAIWLRRMGR